MRKRAVIRLLLILFGFITVVAFLRYMISFDETKSSKVYTFSPDLEYLKFVNQQHSNTDQRLAFLLLLDFLNKGRYEEGFDFFSELIDQHGDHLEPNQRALYLNSLAMLEASRGKSLSPKERKLLLKDIIKIIKNAEQQFSEGDFLNQFLATLAFSKFFDDPNSRQEAITRFEVLEKMRKNPFQQGLMREIYHQLARIFLKEGNQDKANYYLDLSGFDSFDFQGSFFTSFSVSKEFGYNSQSKEIKEIVKGAVYQVSGFGINDIAFIISEDQKELITIGALTQPDQAQRAYDYFRQKIPDVPVVSTTIVIHADWDEIGGFQFFQKLNPHIRVYASENYAKSLEFYKRSKVPFNYIYGTNFSKELLDQFKPNRLINKQTTVVLGGTKFILMPMEKVADKSSDHLFVYLPKDEILFVGDFITPFFGSSYMEGVPLNEIFVMMEAVIDLNPNQIVFSDPLLNEEWGSVDRINDMKEILTWMQKDIQSRVANGETKEEIMRVNMVPPFLLDMPHMEYAYFRLREPMIEFVHRDVSGKTGMEELANEKLSDLEFGIFLTEYLDLSEDRLSEIVLEMIDNGEYDLASKVVTSGLARYPDSKLLNDQYRLTLLKLKEKHQFTNPIKFIIYSEKLGNETPQLRE